jgi:hypothetical protein
MPRIHQEYHDIDYAHKLSPEEKEWLSRFMDETLASRSCDDGDDHYSSPEDRRRIYTESNARRRDIYGVEKVRRRLRSLDRVAIEDSHSDDRWLALVDAFPTTNPHLNEDALIAAIDSYKKEPS